MDPPTTPTTSKIHNQCEKTTESIPKNRTLVLGRPVYDIASPGSKSSVFWIVFASVAAIFAALLAYTNASLDVKNCKIPYMQQAYYEFPLFNESSSRLGSKYSLHLYHEEDTTTNDVEDSSNVHMAGPGFNLSGTPVLFIPGNAGSFRQVRSFAAEGYDRALSSQFSSLSHLNFFSLNFREDLTAFSGELLLDQAEYVNDAVQFILSLYSHNESMSDRSVILIGHSMGGVVARASFMLPNYMPGSVDTIFTFAAPHVLPPSTFDPHVVAVYKDIDAFWHNNLYDQEETKFNYRSRNILSNVAVISFAGGSLDTMIPSDHASLAGKIPEENGFTVYTSSIPHVWSGIDHQAVMWCDQLRKVVIDALEDISSVVRMPLGQRMATFRQKFLNKSPLESGAVLSTSSHALRTIKHSDVKNLCTSVSRVPANGYIAHVSQSPLLDHNVLVCSNESKAGKVTCRDLAKDPNYMAILAPTGQYLTHTNVSASEDDFLCFLAPDQTFNVSVASDVFVDVGASYNHIKIPAVRPAMVDLSLKGIWSSLLSYNVQVLSDEPAENFIFRQHIDTSPFEYRFFPGDSPFKINVHGIAPFVPYSVPRNVHLQLWTVEPELAKDIELLISVDYFGSLSRIALHYRSALAVFPVLVLALSMAIQLTVYYKYGQFVSITTAIQVFAERFLVWLVGLTCILPYIMSHSLPRRALAAMQLLSDGGQNNVIQFSSLYMGLPSSHMWALGPALMVVSTGVCYSTCLMVQVLVDVMAWFLRTPVAYLTSTTLVVRMWNSGCWIEVLSTFGLLVVSFIVPHPVTFVVLLLFSLILASSIRAYRDTLWSRIASTSLVEITDVPAVSTPTINVPSLSLDSAVCDYSKSPSTKFIITIVCILLWTLPENILSASVWLQNYNSGWIMTSQPLSSFFSVVGFSILLFCCSKSIMPPLTLPTYLVSMALLFYIAFYTLLFGMQYSYWIHQLWNIFSFWLALMYIN